MNRVRVSRGDKLILDDVTLAFMPGAKIGVSHHRYNRAPE
jgi:hypothetical protein